MGEFSPILYNMKTRTGGAGSVKLFYMKSGYEMIERQLVGLIGVELIDVRSFLSNSEL